MDGKTQPSYDLSSEYDSKNLTIYYFPTSYSSQKVLFALFEKKLKFRPRLVSLFHGQHMEPWYVRLNPDGVHVPVLKDGETIINHPDEIIDYIDSHSESGPTLVPSPDTELGKSVASLREQLYNIPVDIITYGVIFHPHLSPSGCAIPAAVQRSMKENFTKRLCVFAHKATRHPSLRDAYLAKSQIAAQKYDVITDKENVKVQFYQLDVLFEEIESILRSNKQKHEVEADMFLFGSEFTAADISLCCLLSRLSLLGMESRFFPPNKNPNILSYFHRTQQRKAFQKIQDEVEDLRWTLIWEDVKAASPYMAGATAVGMTLFAVYYFVKKVTK